MSEQTTFRVPILAGGESRQHPAVRLPGQTGTATNVEFSLIDGCSTRPGTLIDRVVTGLTGAGNYRTHPIDRDNGAERYAVVYGRVGSNMAVRAFRMPSNGAEATVNISGDAQAYLNAGSATADDLRFLTVADTTFILNSKVVPALKTADRYTVERVVATDAQVFSQPGKYLSVYQAQASSPTSPAGFWRYDDNAGNGTIRAAGSQSLFASIQLPTVATGGAIDWTDAASYTARPASGFRISFRKGSLSATNLSWDNTTKLLSSGGPSFYGVGDVEVGDFVRVSVAGTSGLSVGTWYRVTALGTFGTQLYLDASGASGNNVQVSDSGCESSVVTDFRAAGVTTMDEVALEIQRALRAANAPDACCSWTWTRSGANRAGYFTVTSPYRGSLATIPAVYSGAVIGAAVASAFDLAAASAPFNPTGSVVTAGAGNAASRTLPVANRWKRVAASGQTTAVVDATTMPVVMRRTVLGSPASSPSTFTIELATWSDRTSGNEASNKPPTIFTTGTPIRDLAVHRDRLALCSGERILLSQSGDYFNLWIDDVDVITDSDPIDVGPNSSQVADFRRLIPFRRALLAAGPGQQYELSSPDILSPTTASLTQTTSLRLLDVEPSVLGSRVYLFGLNPQGTVYEYFYDDANVLSSSADLTVHCAGLLPTTVRTLAADPSTNSVLMLPNGTGSTVYVYRSFWLGSRKEQSAWATWTLGASARIADVCVLGEEAVMLVETAGQFTIQRWPLRERLSPFSPALDARVTLTGGSFAGGNTTWTLPGSVSDSTLDRVVANGIVYTTTRPSATQIRVSGVDLSAGSHVGGRSFASSVELSRPYLRNIEGFADLSANTTLREFTFAFQNSGDFVIRAVTPLRADRTRTFSAPAGTVSTGQITFWISGDPEQTKVFLESLAGGGRPFSIVSYTGTMDAVPLQR